MILTTFGYSSDMSERMLAMLKGGVHAQGPFVEFWVQSSWKWLVAFLIVCLL